MSTPVNETSSHDTRSWREAIARFRRPVLRASVWQLLNTLVPYVALWAVMIWSLDVSYWLTLALTVPAAGLLVRIFIIFHDCGHGSFFRSRRANRITEFVTGVLTFTPYGHWRHEHARHHATSGDLDRRGTGDIWTLTVQEYLEASRWKRFAYRLARNPFVLFVLAPLFMFVVYERFPSKHAGNRQRRGVYWTNIALTLLVVTMGLTIGFRAYVMIQLPLMAIAGGAGVWLFYVQHQFEDVQWARREEWDYVEAAIHGSSFYKLPRVLQWFTGNIGFHHVHHLNPAIPNYNLERCHRAIAAFREIKPITLLASLKTLSYRLWDEQTQQLIGFRQLRAVRAEARVPAVRR